MNHIYQGRVTKVQRLKADAKDSPAFLSFTPTGLKWAWTSAEKGLSYQRPSATDHLFSAIEKGRSLSEAGEEKWDGLEVHLMNCEPKEHENVKNRLSMHLLR